MSLSRQPVALSAASTGAASGASIAAVAPLSGSCRRTPKLSLRQRNRRGCAGMWVSGRDRHHCFVRHPRPWPARPLAQGSGPSEHTEKKNPCYLVAMSIDVVDLRNFYAQRLGVVARRFVGRGIRKRFADTRGMSVLGVGYPTPYLGLFREEAERCLAFMPAVQGVVKWPTNRPSLAALVDELELPLTDSAVDRVLLVHALEMARDPNALLREVWRVLAGGGRLLIVVPNRRGVWARLDTTPF